MIITFWIYCIIGDLNSDPIIFIFMKKEYVSALLISVSKQDVKTWG